MQTFKEYKPTDFDSAGLGSDETNQAWLVIPVIQTRDSDSFELSNFAAALEMLGGEGEDVQVHRFGHWGPGWFEIIIVNPLNPAILKIAEDIERSLESYPLLDDEDYSEREYEAQHEYIKCCSKGLESDDEIHAVWEYCYAHNGCDGDNIDNKLMEQAIEHLGFTEKGRLFKVLDDMYLDDVLTFLSEYFVTRTAQKREASEYKYCNRNWLEIADSLEKLAQTV
jgi:hypothetical protein